MENMEKVLFLQIGPAHMKKPFFLFLRLVPKGVYHFGGKKTAVFMVDCAPDRGSLNRILRKARRTKIGTVGICGEVPAGGRPASPFMTGGSALREAMAWRELVLLAAQKPVLCLLDADTPAGMKLAHALTAYFSFIHLYGQNKDALERLAAQIYEKTGLAMPVFFNTAPKADLYILCDKKSDLPGPLPDCGRLWPMQQEQFFRLRQPVAFLPAELPSAFAAALALAMAGKEYREFWQKIPSAEKRKSWNALLPKTGLLPQDKQKNKLLALELT